MVTYLFSFPQRYIPDFVSIRQVQLLYINRFYATVITNSQPGYYSIFNIAKLQGTTKRHTTIYEVIYTLFTVFETYRTFTKFSLQQKINCLYNKMPVEDNEIFLFAPQAFFLLVFIG